MSCLLSDLFNFIVLLWVPAEERNMLQAEQVQHTGFESSLSGVSKVQHRPLAIPTLLCQHGFI